MLLYRVVVDGLGLRKSVLDEINLFTLIKVITKVLWLTQRYGSSPPISICRYLWILFGISKALNYRHIITILIFHNRILLLFWLLLLSHYIDILDLFQMTVWTYSIKSLCLIRIMDHKLLFLTRTRIERGVSFHLRSFIPKVSLVCSGLQPRVLLILVAWVINSTAGVIIVILMFGLDRGLMSHERKHWTHNVSSLIVMDLCRIGCVLLMDLYLFFSY